MAIKWGSWSKAGANWFAVGVDWSISGTKVTVRYYVKDRYSNANDNQTLNLDGKYSGGQIINYRFTGGTKHVATRSWRGSLGGSYTVGAHAYGIYNGARPSVSRRVTIPARKPSKVGIPRVNRVYRTQATVHWSAPANNGSAIRDYRIDISPGTYWIMGRGNTKPFHITGLTPNTSYKVRVRAKNGKGWGPPSNWRSFTTGMSRPKAPTWVTAYHVSDTTAKVTWTHNGTSEAPYRSQRVQLKYTLENGSWSSWRTVATVGKSARSWTGTGIMAPGAQHRYRVQAINPAGSSMSRESLSIRSRPLPPGAPKARKTSSGNIAVTWPSGNRYSDYLEYQIEDNPNGKGWEVVATGVGSRSWNHVGPDPAQTHQYRVRVLDTYRSANRYSSWSDVSNTVQLQAPPKAPLLRSPVDGAALDGADPVRFVWGHTPVDSSGQTEYELRYRPAGSSTWETVTGSTDEHLEVGLSPASARSSWEWQVRTRGADPSFGPWSSTGRFVLSTRPVVTLQPVTDPYGYASVTAEWSYDGGGSASQLQQAEWRVRLETSDETVRQDGASDSSTSYRFDVWLDNATEYTIWLRAKNGDGLWSAEESLTFTTEFPLPKVVTPSLVWDRETGAVVVSLALDPFAQGVTYRWAGEPGSSVSELVREGTVEASNLVVCPSFEYGSAGWQALDSGAVESVTEPRDRFLDVGGATGANVGKVAGRAASVFTVTPDAGVAGRAALSSVEADGLVLRLQTSADGSTWQDVAVSEFAAADYDLEFGVEDTVAGVVPAGHSSGRVVVEGVSDSAGAPVVLFDRVMGAAGADEAAAADQVESYFDGDTLGLVAPDAVDVQRRDAGGDWVLIGSGLDAETSIVDRTPRLGRVTYRVISRTVLPTQATGPDVSIEWEHAGCPVFVNGSSGMSTVCTGYGDSVDDKPEVESATVRFAGHRKSTALFGVGRSRSVSFSGRVLPTQAGEVSSLDDWFGLLHEFDLVCFRDCTGRKVFGVLEVDGSVTRATVEYSVSVEETEYDENVARVPVEELA